MGKAVVNIRMEDFLRTGVFSAVRFGMTREELQEILGQPDFFNKRRKDRYPTLLEYGDFEFYFRSSEDNRLCSINLDHFNEIVGNESLKIDPWLLKGQLSVSEAENGLKEAEISFQHTSDHDPTMICITTQAGVKLRFCREPKDVGDPPEGLYSIVYFDRQEITKPVKQVSITIPEEIYQKIHQESLKRRIKISKICSQWIVEQAAKLDDET